MRHEPSAEFLQHRLILTREKIRLAVISSYFQCSSQMKSDSLFPSWICLGKSRLLVVGSVGFLVLLYCNCGAS